MLSTAIVNKNNKSWIMMNQESLNAYEKSARIRILNARARTQISAYLVLQMCLAEAK